MGLGEIGLVVVGAFAGGFVSGLTGFGTGITAMAFWLYAIPPPVAASLAIVCSVVSQTQNLPLIWRRIEWSLVLPFVVPGVLGVPIGTWLLPHTDPRLFKIGVGLFLAIYSIYVLMKNASVVRSWGGRGADGAVGFLGGILGGLSGLSGPAPIVWTDFRGYTKHHRRSVLQCFNLMILTVALGTHAVSGLLTQQVGLATLAALPGTTAGAWVGSRLYTRLADRNYQRIVMILLTISGVSLVLTSW
ncbi:MAG: sulfite exporter TauE/SafE family protein [Rhodospirillales bacterium]